jgi:hypothetical protein
MGSLLPTCKRVGTCMSHPRRIECFLPNFYINLGGPHLDPKLDAGCLLRSAPLRGYKAGPALNSRVDSHYIFTPSLIRRTSHPLHTTPIRSSVEDCGIRIRLNRWFHPVSAHARCAATLADDHDRTPLQQHMATHHDHGPASRRHVHHPPMRTSIPSRRQPNALDGNRGRYIRLRHGKSSRTPQPSPRGGVWCERWPHHAGISLAGGIPRH